MLDWLHLLTVTEAVDWGKEGGREKTLGIPAVICLKLCSHWNKEDEVEWVSDIKV